MLNENYKISFDSGVYYLNNNIKDIKEELYYHYRACNILHDISFNKI